MKIDDLLAEDYSHAQEEKKVHHSPLFHVLLWAGVVLVCFIVVLLILYFAAGIRLSSVLSIVLLAENALLFLAFIPALFHLYQKGTPQMILISLICFAFFAAFSWGSFFMALAKGGVHDPLVWLVLGYALFLSATSAFLFRLHLRSREGGQGTSTQPNSAEKQGKSIQILSLIGAVMSLLFAILVSAFTHGWVWGNDDFRLSMFYVLSLSFLLGFGLLSLLSLILYFIDSRKKRKSFLLPILLSATLLLSALLPLSFTIAEKGAYADYYSYSAEKWQEYRGNDRYRMFPSFEKDHQIVGASEATISAWLGVADSTREETNSQGFSWIYDLGPDGLGIDNYLLCITFSHEKIATSYSVYDS